MAQQTTVEWLEEQLKKQGFLYDLDIEAAKQMEKEQIEKAYQQGALDGYEPNYGSGETYYNVTFGNQ